ncbi:hypothetical protein CR513_25008, partial [Mucuna pruriens]
NDYLKGDSILLLYVLLDSFLIFFFLVIEAEEDQAVDVDSDVPNELAVMAHYRASDYMKSQHEINEMVEQTIAEPHIVNLSTINSKFLLDCWNHRLKTSLSISDIAYYKNHILSIGKAILKRLEWYLTVSTPCLSLIIRDFGQIDQQMENMVFFLAELGLVHYQTILFLPIITDTTALYAARCMINRRPILKHKDCAKLLEWNFEAKWLANEQIEVNKSRVIEGQAN